MKLDINVIQYIFNYVENSSCDIVYPSNMANDRYDFDTLNFHIKLLADQNYLEIIDATTFEGRNFLIKGITMQGYDYLDSIRETTTCKANEPSVQNRPILNTTFNIYNPVNSIIGNQENATVTEKKE